MLSESQQKPKPRRHHNIHNKTETGNQTTPKSKSQARHTYVHHKGYVRILIFVGILQENLRYLYVPHIFVHIYCALV